MVIKQFSQMNQIHFFLTNFILLQYCSLKTDDQKQKFLMKGDQREQVAHEVKYEYARFIYEYVYEKDANLFKFFELIHYVNNFNFFFYKKCDKYYPTPFVTTLCHLNQTYYDSELEFIKTLFSDPLIWRNIIKYSLSASHNETESIFLKHFRKRIVSRLSEISIKSSLTKYSYNNIIPYSLNNHNIMNFVKFSKNVFNSNYEIVADPIKISICKNLGVNSFILRHIPRFYYCERKKEECVSKIKSFNISNAMCSM